MALPPGAGRIGRTAGKSIVELVVDLHVNQGRIVGWQDVRTYLVQRGAPAEPVSTAVLYYQTALAQEKLARDALLELLAIDFSKPVEHVQLNPGPGTHDFLTYVQTSPVRDGTRPNEGRVRLDPESRRPVKLHLGGFLTNVGVGWYQVGLSPTPPRTGVKLKLLQKVHALKSRSSGLIDAWSDRPFVHPGIRSELAVPRMAWGGGVQYRLPKAVVSSDEYFAIL